MRSKDKSQFFESACSERMGSAELDMFFNGLTSLASVACCQRMPVNNTLLGNPASVSSIRLDIQLK